MSKENGSLFKENLGKVLVDLGKLAFGSFVLGGILRGQISQLIVLASGSAASIGLIWFGLWLSSKKQRKEE